MTPFSTIIPVSKYLSMGYSPKSGSTIYKLDGGQYHQYCVIKSYDEASKNWVGEVRGKIEKVDITNKHIQIMVVPFDQYLKKANSKSLK